MSILDDIFDAVGSAFNDDPDSAFRPAELFKRVSPTSSFGPSTQTSVQAVPCRVFVERFDRRTRAALDIPDTDVQLVILQMGGVVVDMGDTIVTGAPIAGEWRVEALDQDPAGATWIAQGRPVNG